MLITLPHKFIPRDYQRDLMKAVFVDKYKHVYWIVHRRAGKTKTAINVLTTAALQEPALYVYLMPQTNQARKVIWKGRGSDGVRFLDHIPSQLISKVNNSDMSVELINGSIIQFVGSNNYDSLMGINSRLIMYDEYPLQNPMAYELLSPILLESGGCEILFGTPRGHNHGYETYQMAINNPAWYVKKLSIDDTRRTDGTPIITLDQIEQERLSGKSEEIIQQEYWCSFDIGNEGAYYTKEIAFAEYENRILDFNINPNLPVHTSWDIGVGDATSICFFQQNGIYLDYIGYIEGNNKGLQDYYKEMHDFKARHGIKKWGYHFAPHDIRNREWANSARSRLQVAADLGLHFLIVPDLAIQDRIDAGRAFMREVRFHKTFCKQLIRCLREAMREYDEIRKVFDDKPLHNWALHGFDSYTYGAVAWRHQFSRPDLNQIRKYEMG
jgi:phage terminase large subunit